MPRPDGPSTGSCDHWPLVRNHVSSLIVSMVEGPVEPPKSSSPSGLTAMEKWERALGPGKSSSVQADPSHDQKSPNT